MRRRWLAVTGLVVLASAATAQNDAVHRTTLQVAPFPAAPLHTVTVRVVIDQGGQVAPHTHPGLEVAYIIEGRARLSERCVPDRQLAAGQSFQVLPGTVHALRNTGPGALTVLSTYVVEQTQPISLPAHGGTGCEKLRAWGGNQ